jgi:two-component system nitrogen regulation response regulator GlnG
MAPLVAFDYPGNVRQLENICHWLTVMAPAQVVEAKDLPPEVAQVQAAPAAPAPAQVSPPPAPEAAPAAAPPAAARHATAPVEPAAPSHWQHDLEREARAMLQGGSPEVWDTLTRQFEGRLIRTALEVTRGRRIEAAQKLGIGRNTITRKIQELGLDD